MTLRMSALGAAAAVAVLIGSSTTAAHAAATTQLLVKFKATTPGALRADVLDEADADPSGTLHNLGVTVVKVDTADAAAALAKLRASGTVAYAERDVPVHATGAITPTDPLYAANAWPFVNTAIATAWSAGTGSSVTVAVIDTGVNPVSEIAGRVLPGYNAIDGSTNTADDNMHGTNVSSLIAGAGNNGIGAAGVCWSCRILPVKALGSGGSGSTSDVARGITWATDHGAQVINLSLGGGFDQAELDAVAYARAHNVVVVASAGNEGNTAMEYPAAAPGAISVAASDASDNRYSFSTYGSWVNVAAPGCAMAQTLTGAFGTFCGTSAAAPIVSGIAALARSDAPAATAAQVTQALTQSTDPVPGGYVGGGRVNAAKALQSLGVPLQVPAAPVKTVAPSVSGVAQVGQTLTATTGTWQNATSYTYMWIRCSGAGGVGCAAIAGATGTTYRVATADAGGYLGVHVTAKGPGGSTMAPSPLTAQVTVAAPVKTVAPSISGVARVGQTLTATTGTWQNATSYGYLWIRCSGVGTGCSLIAGATGPTYKVVTADVGSYLSVHVTATGPGGSTMAPSPLTAQVAAAAAAPVKTVAPSVSGVVRVGQTLTTTPGTWQNATGFAYAWIRCSGVGTGCSLIAGAAGPTYKVVTADVGSYLGVHVTATGPGGSTMAPSLLTAQVTT